MIYGSSINFQQPNKSGLDEKSRQLIEESSRQSDGNSERIE